jgi:hypothetical protein
MFASSATAMVRKSSGSASGWPWKWPAEIASPQAAQRIQLATEYDPEPPFAAGSPDRAPVEVSDELKAFFAVRTAEFKNEISAALAAA